MQHEFWLDKWNRNDIAFDQPEVNALLVAHLRALSLAPGSRILVPLCGKSRDVAWLLEQGHEVVGCELSGIAVAQLFELLGRTPEISELPPVRKFHAKDIDIFAGDFFGVSSSTVGPVDAVYDRAALVALPAAMRTEYAAHLADISRCAPQLLIGYEYHADLLEGPPFSVDRAEIERLYAGDYQISELARAEAPGGIRGKSVIETAWHLAPR